MALSSVFRAETVFSTRMDAYTAGVRFLISGRVWISDVILYFRNTFFLRLHKSKIAAGEMSGGTAMDTMSSAPHMNEDNAIRYLTSFGKA